MLGSILLKKIESMPYDPTNFSQEELENAIMKVESSDELKIGSSLGFGAKGNVDLAIIGKLRF